MKPTRPIPTHCASEAGSGLAATSALPAALAREPLRDGEVILLLMRPSLWYIPLSCLHFITAAALLAALFAVFEKRLGTVAQYYIQAFIFVLAGRIVWSALNWMGRVYMLTNLRVVRLQGVFNVDLYEVPLKKVAEVELTRLTREKVCGVGSLRITPEDDRRSDLWWHMVSRPAEVLPIVQAAVHRARQRE